MLQEPMGADRGGNSDPHIGKAFDTMHSVVG